MLISSSLCNATQYALSNLGGSPWEAGRLKLGKEAEASISSLELERYARSRWDSVLHFMVGSTAVKEPPQSVVEILLRTKLMQQSVDKRAYHITDTGYEFMLKDIHVQMWIFMLEYIKTLDNSGALKQEDILQFLFQIRHVYLHAFARCFTCIYLANYTSSDEWITLATARRTSTTPRAI